MKYYGITDKGLVRKQNQDVFLCEEIRVFDAALLVVCDGMGGARSGNVASKLAAEEFKQVLDAELDPFIDREVAAKLMKTAAGAANRAVYARSVTDEACEGMGTTLVAALVRDDGAVILNIGDSRAYLLTRTEGIQQLTRDHSVVADMVARGDITPEQARSHPNRNLITRAIGTADDVEADVQYVPLKQGDILLLCTDGLTSVVDDRKITEIVFEEADAEACCKALVQAAVDGGAPDNITAVLLTM